MGINYNSIIMKVIYSIAFCTALLVTGCQEQTEEPLKEKSSNLSLNINTASDTRSKANFILGDEVGLFVTSGNIGDHYNSITTNNNVKATNTGSGWSIPDVELTAAPATIYAYYPYSSTCKDGRNIEIKTSTQTEWMFGTHTNGQGVINNSNNTVSLTLRKVLSRIRFHLKKEGYTGAGKLTNISISEHPLIGSLNVSTGTISHSNNEGILNQAQNLTLETTYSSPVDILLFPTISLANQPVITFLIDGWAYRFRLNDLLKLEQGLSYDYHLILKQDHLLVVNENIQISNLVTDYQVLTNHYTSDNFSVEIFTKDINPYNEVSLKGAMGIAEVKTIKLPLNTKELLVEVRVKKYLDGVISPQQSQITVMYSVLDGTPGAIDNQKIEQFTSSNGDIQQTIKVGLHPKFNRFEFTIAGAS